MKPINANIVTILPDDQRDHVLCMYFNDIRHTKPIEHEETLRYIVLAQNGDQEALDKIVTANLKFVITVAKRYLIKGLDIKDLISEGNLGLIDAVMAYNIKREPNVKFISYAVFHIRKRILQYIEKNISVCKIPQNIMRHVMMIHKHSQEERENEYYNTIYYYYPEIYTKVVQAIYATRYISIYAQLNYEDEKMFIDVVPDEDMSIIHKTEAKKRDINYIIQKSMSVLDELEKKVIDTYYIKLRGECSFEFAASVIDISFEEFKKVHQRALKKIRQYIFNNFFEETLELLYD